jgi:hypothetical protein
MNQNSRIVPFIDEKVENIDPTLSDPLSSPDIVEAKKIQTEVLDHFIRDYDSFLAGNKPYLETRKKVRDDYASGKKDTTTLKSFSYLSSLEGKWDDYQKVKKDICANVDLCRKSTTHVELS